MSLAGVINSHTMAALIVLHHGTDEQRAPLPAALRQRRRRAAASASPSRTPAPTCRPSARWRARRRRPLPRLRHARCSSPTAARAIPSRCSPSPIPPRSPRHRGMSCFIVEKGAPGPRGREVHRQARLQGRRHRGAALRRLPRARRRTWSAAWRAAASSTSCAGSRPGRINIAARAVGVAQAGLTRRRARRARARHAEPPRRCSPTSPRAWRRPGSSPTGPPA